MRCVVLAAACVIAPAGAHAIDYMTAEQAAKSIFPAADNFDLGAFKLDSAEMQRLASVGIQSRSVDWSFRIASHAGTALGYVVVDEVIGKFELITYAVGIALDGSVIQIEVLSYRESHGSEIRMTGWRKQFVGKTSAAPIRVGEDIANISGATLSCKHVTDGVRRVVSVVDLARKNGKLQ
jgi:Na+-translocating ferredoxin:NAD+ oxidoreductase RnfG subunit